MYGSATSAVILFFPNGLLRVHGLDFVDKHMREFIINESTDISSMNPTKNVFERGQMKLLKCRLMSERRGV